MVVRWRIRKPPSDAGRGIYRAYCGKFNTFQRLRSDAVLSIMPEDKAYEVPPAAPRTVKVR